MPEVSGPSLLLTLRWSSRIRTRGPTLSTRPTGYADDGGHGRRSPRPGTSERQEHLDASALRPKGRLQQPHRKFLVAAAANGTEGSNPASSGGESGDHARARDASQNSFKWRAVFAT